MCKLCQKSGCSIVVGEDQPTFLVLACFCVLQQNIKVRNSSRIEIARKGCQTACKPGSVPPREQILRRGWPFLWDARCRAPRATDPSGGAKARPAPRIAPECLPLLLGLAPGGVFPAAAVAGGAVRSYRTVSPLPPARRSGTERRCTFCGTFPGVAPAGRYPAPYLRGARTFLPPPEGGERPSGRLAI